MQLAGVRLSTSHDIGGSGTAFGAAYAILPAMIERMRKKQRAAAFFLRLMNEECDPTYSTDPEKIEAFLYAFLAATRTVTSMVEKRYESWYWPWHDGRSPEEQELLDFLIGQRNAGQHRGEDKFEIKVKSVPYVGGIPTVQGMRMPGKSGPPSEIHVARHRYTFEIHGETVDIEQACQRYLQLLDSFVRDFTEVHPAEGQQNV